MGNRRRRGPAACLLLCFLMTGFELCASLNHEGLALLRFREMVEADPSGALADWDEGHASPCSWFGVQCSDDGRVVGLNLSNLGLKGMLSPEIGQLTNMHSLFLKGNRLYGDLPLKLNEFISLCESQVQQDRALSNRMPTARSKDSATIRKLLAVKQKYSPNNELLGSENSVLQPSDVSPFFSLQELRKDPTPPPAKPSIPPARPDSEHVPSHAPTVSPNKDRTRSQESKSNSRNSSFVTIYALIGAAICFVVLSLSAAILICYRRGKTSSVVPLSSSRQLQTTIMGGIASFRRSELETACEDFSNVIGTLPGCTLYKGTLPCGAEIAVVSTLIKHAYGWSAIAEAQFKNKYVSNGSLFESLHVNEAEHLNWQSRLRMAMGAIYCLNHMYQQYPPVILRNLNSSCIYLTEDNAAKISDISFGDDRKESEDEFDEPDECSIVYKFALLLLEAISGRRPFPMTPAS
ncbi:hypothetical protein ZWY2020_019733 [Hordeum vulgare]|nr:hypothetical protein ZWY2020_019733 [Hordeum vulgare]